ncbi:MAG: alpha/beta hydrolase [Chitinophagaceae bacterium]|nr:alpha/beta hydrolase [Chitinophagaceae bacterium]
MKKLFLLVCFYTSFQNIHAQIIPENYVIVHGAWGGAWDWKKVDSLLSATGNKVYRVTLTGLGEKYHLANAKIGLYTHIYDVVNTILFEDLHNVVLVGHSYGGMVITGVADSLSSRIKRLVYIDALLPNNGENVISAKGAGVSERLKQMSANLTKDSLIIPTWVKAGAMFPKDVPHPAKTFLDTLWLKNKAALKLPATYILTVDAGKKPEEDDFAVFADRAKKRGFTYYQMDNTGHTPERSKPRELVELMLPPKKQ